MAALFVGIPMLVILFGGFIALLIWGASRGPSDAERLAALSRPADARTSALTRPHVSTDFEVECRWKEEVIYWEGRRGFIFDAGWGVEPPVLYVPSAEAWDRCTANWMVGRHDEIVDRLAGRSGHRIEVGHYDPNSAGRWTAR